MRNPQYIIQGVNNNLIASWNKNIILFDTQEEAEEIISSNFKFSGRNPFVKLRMELICIGDNFLSVKRKVAARNGGDIFISRSLTYAT